MTIASIAPTHVRSRFAQIVGICAIVLFVMLSVAASLEKAHYQPARIIPSAAPSLVETVSGHAEEGSHSGSNMSVADISLLQVQFLDFLNGESQLNQSQVFGGSLDKDFNADKNWRALYAITKELPRQPYERTDFVAMAVRSRAHYIAYRVLYETSDNDFHRLAQASGEADTSAFRNSLNLIVSELEKLLYPWLQPTAESVFQLRRSIEKGSTGIVITCGNNYFYVTQHLILSLRTVFNISLPVQVYYGGAIDLSPGRIEVLKAMDNVEVIDLHTAAFPSETTIASGWSMKAWALLATRFETVLFMDADITFLRNPLEILKSSLFNTNRHVFHHDRKLWHMGSYPGIQLIKDMNPHLSNYGKQRLFVQSDRIRGTTNEMESGFIPMDKGNTGVFFSLLLATKMNAKVERDEVLYKKVHGDKESFWFASETLRVPYGFLHDFSGSIGVEHQEKSNENYMVICDGKPLHLNEQREPFWFHAGSVLQGWYRSAQPPNYHGFSELRDMVFHYEYKDNEELWDAGISCIRQKRWQTAKVNDEQQALIEKYKDMFRHDIKAII
ncbi:hypothetical protein HDU84_000089 [Entophlyctis sp. JEL0112]|nr:hypothetical protein HDU84_000089 [Entophlyctis sp. JEL0112]